MIASGCAPGICPIDTALYVFELFDALLSAAEDTPRGRRLAVREWASRALREWQGVPGEMASRERAYCVRVIAECDGLRA